MKKDQIGCNLRLDRDPSKQEEIDALHKVADVFRNGDTYLSSFFTNDLLSWCEIQIKNDIGPDLYGTYAYQQSGALSELETLKKDHESTVREVNYLQGQLAGKHNELEQEQKSKAGIIEHCQGVEEKNKDLLSALSEMRAERDEFRNIKESYADELIRLKAKLFDLQEEAEKKS